MKKNPVNEILVLSNPRHKRHAHRRHHKSSRRSYRRNPIMGVSATSAISTLKDGALGAAGGLLNDAAYGYLKGYLPTPLQDGYGRIGAKLGMAVLLGVASNMVMRGKGKAIAVGAATVTLHELGKTLINQQLPSVPLGAYEDNALLGYDSAQILRSNGTGAYMPQGAYMPASGLGGGDFLQP